VCFLALAIASLLNANPLWASGMFLLAITVMAASTLGAISGRGKARMTRSGVALFGWVYLGIVFGPFANGNGTTIPPLPTMVVYEYTLRENLIPRSKAAYKDAKFHNANQAESLLPKHGFTFTPSVSLFVDRDRESDLEVAFNRLSDGGSRFVPVANYGSSTRFAWISDRFRVWWQLSFA
jgi:hypothetical protein